MFFVNHTTESHRSIKSSRFAIAFWVCSQDLRSFLGLKPGCLFSLYRMMPLIPPFLSQAPGGWCFGQAAGGRGDSHREEERCSRAVLLGGLSDPGGPRAAAPGSRCVSDPVLGSICLLFWVKFTLMNACCRNGWIFFSFSFFYLMWMDLLLIGFWNGLFAVQNRGFPEHPLVCDCVVYRIFCESFVPLNQYMQ